ncbi:MAG: hypothetical protein H7840_02675 [Alphaproteobacteria bacterium]
MTVMRTALLALLPLLGAAAETGAEPMCDDHRSIVEALAKGYAERLSAVGIAGGAGVLEVFASSAGTWSIVVTDPGGQSCIMAVGTGWETLPPQVAGREPPRDGGI